ncbi:hypothetical protein FB45DRAFT_979333 [Roridomyces roridus]|uniref:Aminoglycoside phosphotransferase domain-containing protein n=1 Tax=Roridomyces roridus TaxID=1738132 RepID=A0AAD7BR78_9AGAR|nr:hypothetical protein FB45DRAFT_979333 [Roridomyces roridus]
MYPVLVPKFHAIASYSPTSDNAAKTEYIFMEFVKGTKFADVWLQLKEADLASVLRQLVKLESLMMSIPFPAGGSLYFADDLEKIAGEKTGIPMWLNGERFCIGPDVRVHMWYGRQSQLDALAAAALKEITYLERFGQPLLPFQRGRREAYNYEKQSPLDHIENLQRYLLIAPSLMPDNPSLREFCIRHPDLQPSNVMVSTSPDSGQLEIVSLIDWQHASILARFLLTGIPDEMQNHNDPISMHLIPPVFPSDADKMDEADLSQAKVTHHDRLVHFHYTKGTEEYNKAHHDALWDPKSLLIRHLFSEAGYPWEGETHDLKAALVRVTERWGTLMGRRVACPVKFEQDDVSKTKAFSETLESDDENVRSFRELIGYGKAEAWVPTENYGKAKERASDLIEAVGVWLKKQSRFPG